MRLQDKLSVAKHVGILKLYQPLAMHGKKRVEGLTAKNLATGEDRRLEVQGVFTEVGLYLNTNSLLDL